MNYKITKNMINFLKSVEPFEKSLVQGIIHKKNMIGYGTIIGPMGYNVHFHEIGDISEDQALSLLNHDLQSILDNIKNNSILKFKENEICALASFALSLGPQLFQCSNIFNVMTKGGVDILPKYSNSMLKNFIFDRIGVWYFSNETEPETIKIRRAKEKDLFKNGF